MADASSQIRDSSTKYEASDTLSHNLSEPIWDPEVTNNLRSAYPPDAPPNIPKRQVTRVPTLGPSRSGKTYTINDSFCGEKEPMTRDRYEATNHVEITSVRSKGKSFELIDTPGFDNVGMSDVEAFAEIARDLRDPKYIKKGITGIIYVHRAGNTVHSRSLLRNFRVLANLFLGIPGLQRLKFLVTQIDTQEADHKKSLDEIRARGSAFSAAFSAGATVASSPNRAGFTSIIESYLSQKSIMLPVQLDKSYRSHTALITRVEEELGYYEYAAAQLLLDCREQYLKERYEQQLASQLEAEAQLRYQLRQSKRELTRLHELKEQLRQQLQELQCSYSSLESQLRLQKNSEQNHGALILDSLNHMIRDIGGSLSAYLTNNHVLATFGKDSSDITALDALDLPALKALLSHADGESSLVASSTGRGMPIERFFGYSVRSLICQYLAQSVFEPFHPGVNPSLSQSLLKTYKMLQKHDSQVSVSKWRSETFKSISACDPDCPDTTKHDVDPHLNKIINNQLKPLIKHVLGVSIPLEEDHYVRLRRIITMAWDWNSSLKGNGLILEDFVQTAFRHPCPLNLELMEGYEAKPCSHRLPHVLGTLALGLFSRTAIGGENPVEQKTLRKALVVTSSI